MSVASATCYTLDLTARDRLLSGVDFGQSINLVHVYEEQVVHSIVPIGDAMEVTGFPIEAWAQIEAMTPEERREAFSSKTSTFGQAERAASRADRSAARTSSRLPRPRAPVRDHGPWSSRPRSPSSRSTSPRTADSARTP